MYISVKIVITNVFPCVGDIFIEIYFDTSLFLHQCYIRINATVGPDHREYISGLIYFLVDQVFLLFISDHRLKKNVDI